MGYLCVLMFVDLCVSRNNEGSGVGCFSWYQKYCIVFSLHFANLFLSSRDRASWQIIIIKPTRCANFSNFILGMKLCMFRTVPLSIIRSFSLYAQQWYMSYRFVDSLRAGSGCSVLNLQTCMTYTIAVCTVKISWCWTEEQSEKCRVSFQNKFEKLVRLVGFIIRILKLCLT